VVPPTSATAPSPDFRAAARRHYVDAAFLLDDSRVPNADHLAGLAAECGLKAILEGWYGAQVLGDFLEWNGERVRSHVNRLWGELSTALAGRTGATLTALLLASAPFTGWDVADRYRDGTAVSDQSARDHVGTAKKVIEILEQAILDGIVP
jgi:HEPN domain-containing protein